MTDIAAVKYVEGKEFPVDTTEFNRECGVGKSIISQALSIHLFTSDRFHDFTERLVCEDIDFSDFTCG